MKKNIMLLLFILILSGCSSKYDLKVTSDGLEENISIVIEKSMIDNQVISSEVEPDDQITPFIKNDSYPLINSTSKTYIKEVTEDNDNYYIKMNYKFNSEEYKNSLALNTCFEHYDYKNEKDYYEIKVSGKFYCLYGDSTEININTPNVVKENNADTNNGDNYTWVINNSNVDNVDISIKIMKQTKLFHYITVAFLVILVIIVLIGALIIYKKLSNRENINKV